MPEVGDFVELRGGPWLVETMDTGECLAASRSITPNSGSKRCTGRRCVRPSCAATANETHNVLLPLPPFCVRRLVGCDAGLHCSIIWRRTRAHSLCNRCENITSSPNCRPSEAARRTLLGRTPLEGRYVGPDGGEPSVDQGIPKWNLNGSPVISVFGSMPWRL